MIGLGVLLIVAAYVALLIAAGVWTRNWGLRLLLWALLLAPFIYKTWDIPIGYWRFRSLCSSDGGVKIYVVNPAEAKRIRLEGARFGAPFAESIMRRRKSLSQVEAADRRYDFTKPVAYSLYERGRWKCCPRN